MPVEMGSSMNISLLILPWDRLEASQVPLDHHGCDHTRKDNLRCGADGENECLLSPSKHCRAGFEGGTNECSVMTGRGHFFQWGFMWDAEVSMGLTCELKVNLSQS